MEVESDDDMYNIELQNRHQKKIDIPTEKENEVSNLTSAASRKTQINPNLDPRNDASRYMIEMKPPKNLQFDHFMRSQFKQECLAEVLEVVREQLQEQLSKSGKEGVEIGKVVDKNMNDILVVRFIEMEADTSGVLNEAIFTIEDSSGRAPLRVTSKNVAWIGMICAIKVRWADSTYILEEVINMGTPIQNASNPAVLKQPNNAYRMLMVKGPFRKKDEKEDMGCMLLFDQLQKLSKYRSGVDCVVVMGPILSIKNTQVEKGTLDKTYDQEFQNLVQIITEKLNKLFPSAKLLLIPNQEDATNLYPLPQPQYTCGYYAPQIRFLSNPSTVEFNEPGNKKFSIDFLNHDLLKYIDENKGGQGLIEVLQANFDTYFKQPFILTNCDEDQSFDETNLPVLYNKGNFGDILVISSENSPPYTRDIKGRLVVNIASLGMHEHVTKKHYMTLMSIYEGEGAVSKRTKIQSIIM